MRVAIIIGGSRDGETIQTKEDMHTLKLIERTQDQKIRDFSRPYGGFAPLDIEHYRLEELRCNETVWYMWVYVTMELEEAISRLFRHYERRKDGRGKTQDA